MSYFVYLEYWDFSYSYKIRKIAIASSKNGAFSERLLSILLPMHCLDKIHVARCNLNLGHWIRHEPSNINTNRLTNTKRSFLPSMLNKFQLYTQTVQTHFEQSAYFTKNRRRVYLEETAIQLACRLIS